MTELLYLRDAYLRRFSATVEAVRAGAVTLDRTAFYPTGGGQPSDAGRLDGVAVTGVTHGREPGEEDVAWHAVESDDLEVGQVVEGEIDWERRHQLMRTHTALHVLCGVIWHRWGKAVTGGNMEPLAARMDFEFDPLPDDFGATVEELADADLIRTKVNMIPETVREIRVVDIVGLDKQADGGTHVRSTDEVGRIRVLKTESKGKSNKRIRLQVR